MKSIWLEECTKYNGSQLRPLYNYLNHNLLGHSIVAWKGSCDVYPENMVDGEDLLSIL